MSKTLTEMLLHKKTDVVREQLVNNSEVFKLNEAVETKNELKQRKRAHFLSLFVINSYDVVTRQREEFSCCFRASFESPLSGEKSCLI